MLNCTCWHEVVFTAFMSSCYQCCEVISFSIVGEYFGSQPWSTSFTCLHTNWRWITAIFLHKVLVPKFWHSSVVLCLKIDRTLWCCVEGNVVQVHRAVLTATMNATSTDASKKHDAEMRRGNGLKRKDWNLRMLKSCHLAEFYFVAFQYMFFCLLFRIGHQELTGLWFNCTIMVICSVWWSTIQVCLHDWACSMASPVLVG